ncbi:MAG: tRNA1(Val) (adenine(37)-N6)-methyltransferase [Bacteroidia bacterium]
MGNSYFQFKQFLVNQEHCAMKVGTDSVLLGCLTSVNAAVNCLDIGTGTGILSLMLAQRNNELQIDAIEIDEQAFVQAKNNFSSSKFSNQIQIHLGALQNFAPNKKYDLIISNPPYFIGKNNFSINDLQRAKARHDNDLPFDVLIESVLKLLNTKGKFVLILPIAEATIFKVLANEKGLFVNNFFFIKPKPNKASNRIIIEFSMKQTVEISEEFIVYNEDNSQTEAYKKLTEEFYL